MKFIQNLKKRYHKHIDSDRRTLLKFLMLPSVSLLSWSYTSDALANQVIAVRVWPSDEYTRVTIETNELLNASHKVLLEPYRLVIDIIDLQLSSQLQNLLSKVLPDNPHIARVRVSQYNENSVRIVFDLKQLIKPQIFSLAPIANYRYRLVFDLRSEDDGDLIRKILQSSKESNINDNRNAQLNDPMQEWLNTNKRPSNSNIHIENNNSPYNNALQKRLTLVIDPGHGGEDSGAVGASGLREKDVVLSIAKYLANIASRYVNVLMTRDADFFVPLGTRVLKARAAKADLFISIHADAFTKISAKGSSVFALSEKGASSNLAKMLATMENNADIIGGINHANKNTQRLLLGFSQDAQIRDSLKLGNYILQNISNINTLHNTRVEQAGFAVLKAPDIPSVLVETAFISNPEEENKLSSSYYKEQMAQAIWNGVRKFLKI